MKMLDELDSAAVLKLSLVILAALVAYTLLAGLSIWISCGPAELRIFLSLFAFYYIVVLAFANLASAFHLWKCGGLEGGKRLLLGLAGLLFGPVAVLCHHLLCHACKGKGAV